MSIPSSKYDAIVELALSQRDCAQRAYQRRGLVISGSKEWCSDVALKIASLFDQQQVWISRQPPKGVAAYVGREVLQCLGREVNLLVYDCHGGFDVDAFGAASGLIKGGGLLLLLTPPLDCWPQLADPEAERFFKSRSASSHFIKRFIQVAQASDALLLVAENAPLPYPPEINDLHAVASGFDAPYRTLDQQTTVAAIVDLGRGQSQRPIVLVSDRGRGKSSALGIAAAQLLNQGCKTILVTAPRLTSVEALFRHTRHLLPQATSNRGLLQYGEASLRFIAPDELIKTTPEADLLLVDEAAAIPIPMLEKILSHYPQPVFATTVYGYEGTGRGFALRFNKVLDLQTPGWQQLCMQQPIRWAEFDALEQFAFDALLLNATIASAGELAGLELSACQVKRVCSDNLMANQLLLSEVFGLLVLAHYRTRPNDLRQLLDSSDLQLHVMSYQDRVVAVVLLGIEGGMDEALAKAVYQGRRRLQGHLVPQSLATHAGLVEAPTLRYLRIMRIAVHPLIQRRGLGSALIREVCASVTDDTFDCLGASFGLTPELLRFWQGLGFVPVRLGLTREHSSGNHSLIMLQSVSETGRYFLEKSYLRMQQQLPTLLAGPLAALDKRLTEMLLLDSYHHKPGMSKLDWHDVVSFAYGLRGYEFCMAAIVAFVKTLPQGFSELKPKQSQLLLVKVLENQSWSETVKSVGFSGRAEAITQLRETMRLLLGCYFDPSLLASIKKLLDL